VHRPEGQDREDQRPDLAASDGALTWPAATQEAAELARKVVEIAVTAGAALVAGRAVMAAGRWVRAG
jgi:hypothetical protein